MTFRTFLFLACLLPAGSFAQNPCDDLDSTFTFTLVGGSTVVFQPNTFNNQWTYFWEFGDGTFDLGPIITHQYPGPTLFQACLTVWAWDPVTQDTCFATSCQLVDLIGQGMPCDSTFSAQITWFDQGSNIIVFQGSTNLNADGYIWQFGDGALGYGMFTQHFYQQPGVYPVCLDAWYWNTGTQDSCWTSTCIQVLVGGSGSVCDSIPLQADLSALVNGNQVQFTDQSMTSGYGATYLWDLGDGTTSVQPAFLHPYAQPGTYLVCLTIAIGPNGGADSCFSTHCELVTTGGGGPCDSLDAGFTANGGPGVNFANSTIDLAWTYSWDFGDGTSGVGPNPFHNFALPGVYQVCLTVSTWDPFIQDTCFATSCQLVDLTGQGDPCDGLLTCFVPSVAGPQAFFFNNCSSSPDPLNTQFLWEFGDGTSSTQFAPIHTFPPGVWQVCLTTFWQNCVDSLCLTVTASGGAPCDSSFMATFGVTLNGNMATFTASSSGQANGYLWTFGDGTQGGGQLVDHVYAPGGPYSACLQAWYWNGTDTCWSAPSCQSIGPFSQNNPCDDLDSTFTFGLVGGSTVVFQPNTFNNQWTYFWEFGDGTSDFGPIFTHQYPGPTLFQACLTVWAWDPFLQDTCFATSCQLVDLTGQGDPCDSLGPTAYFTWTSQGTTFYFEDLSLTGGGPATYLWDFGDGNQSTAQGPIHTFPDTTSQLVCLTVGIWTGTDSCFSTYCQTVFPSNAGPQSVAGRDLYGPWRVGPNPTRDQLVLTTSPDSPDLEVEVLDLHGQRVVPLLLHAGVRSIVPTASLAAGAYLLRLRHGDRVRTLRFIKE